MTKTDTTPAPETAIALRDRPGMSLLLEMAAQVPAVEDDPTDTMMAAILAAGSAQEMERIFTAESLKAHGGDVVTVHTFRVAQSDYQDGPGFYLVCDVTWHETGERTVMTAGSLLTMAQLFNFWQRGDLPYAFEIVVKERATKRGFHPIHLRPLVKFATAADTVITQE